MIRIIPVLRLSRQTDQQLDDYGQHIILMLTGNANFPAPSPTLLVVGAALSAFRDAVAKAIDGSKADTQDKNEKRGDLESLLIQLADDCVAVAAGDFVKFLTSGFDVKKNGQPAGILPAPANFRLITGGNEGELKARWNKVGNNHGYELRWAYENIPAEQMTSVVAVSLTRLILSGLTSGRKVFAYVRATGAKESHGDWSDISGKFVP